ncbi:MAG: NAD(P)/FAD-dependent oxidoreductase [Planctomycetota bacterium]|nr:NAD(P)/FAD-dependent oxidoreductase [Planctomycetota bacterium]
MMKDKFVAIIGGGMSGLSCARRLNAEGCSWKIFEADSAVGGRVQTDKLDGFLLDRGFQVLLDNYVECRNQLDFAAMDLRAFEPGALVRYQGRFHEFSDPLRKPSSIFRTLFAPMGSWRDKIKLSRLRRLTDPRQESSLARFAGLTTREFLSKYGFSKRLIDSFFQPFFGGVFLESDLRTSAGKFRFLFHQFGTGNATIPNLGMGEIPRQLVNALPPENICLGHKVESLSRQRVHLANGDDVDADAVVVATDQTTAVRLLGEPEVDRPHGVWCVYFAAPRDERRPILVLNGEGTGPINSLCWLSAAADGYAPEGQDLASVTVLQNAWDSEGMVEACLTQLQDWYGDEVTRWRHLRTYHVPNALPKQGSTFETGSCNIQHSSGIFRCGDYMEYASLNGAMVSGRECAEEVLRQLG